MDTIKTKQDLINALELTLVDSIQKRLIDKALQCSKMLKLLRGGNHDENHNVMQNADSIRPDSNCIK